MTVAAGRETRVVDRGRAAAARRRRSRTWRGSSRCSGPAPRSPPATPPASTTAPARCCSRPRRRPRATASSRSPGSPGWRAPGSQPRVMGRGPVPAIRKLLARQGRALGDYDVVEINEAFAAQVLSCTRALGLADDAEHVNPNGGAIALGHPLGASGVRLVHDRRARDAAPRRAPRARQPVRRGRTGARALARARLVSGRAGAEPARRGRQARLLDGRRPRGRATSSARASTWCRPRSPPTAATA